MSRCSTSSCFGQDAPLRHASAAQVRYAQRQFSQFMHRKPSRAVRRLLRYPQRWTKHGHATVTSYRSDKFDGIWADYRHDHDGLLHPAILVAHLDPNAPLWEESARPSAFACFGFVLDVQFYHTHCDEPPHFLNYKRRGATAYLCGDGTNPHRLYFIPCDPNAGSVVILESPEMEIRPEGITR